VKEILKEVFQHCIDMQKMAETKNAGLIAFNGAITLAVIKLLSEGSLNCYFHYYFFCPFLFFDLNISKSFSD
jgi:hypothetical protein